jgi:hypothetical protein
MGIGFTKPSFAESSNEVLSAVKTTHLNPAVSVALAVVLLIRFSTHAHQHGRTSSS